MNKQKGFSAVIVLLSLLLLVAVGFTGYFVWNTQNNKKDKSAEVAPATATKQEAQKESPAPAKEEQKYLVIKEWGVSLPLENWSYTLETPQPDKYLGARIYNNTTKDLSENQCGQDFSVAKIVRTENIPQPNDPRKFKKIANYYYGLVFYTQNLCLDNNGQNLANSEFYSSADNDIRTLNDNWDKLIQYSEN